MSKSAKASGAPGLVPRLRFPEFRITGTWSPDALGNICTIYKGRGVSRDDVVTDGRRQCIRYGELYTTYGENIREAISKTNLPDDQLFLSEPGDVIVPASGETKEDIATASCVVNGGVALGGDLNVIRSPLDGSFFAYYVRGVLKTQIAQVAQGDSVVHLYPTQLSKIAISYPRPAEQQKIADCLSSLDDVIAAHTDKLAALKQHKQGLLEQLFPREGETVPRLRFPEFRHAPLWEPRKLVDVAHVVRGGSPRPIADYLTEDKDGLAWLKIGDVSEDAKYIAKTSQRIKRAGLSKTREIHPGDLILSNSMSFGRPYLSQVSACIHDGWLAITDLSHDMSSEFVYYLLTASGCQRYFADAAAGSGVHNLNIDIVEVAPVNAPSKPEQIKIAACLSSVDELLAAESAKLAALKQHKQGLLQQLFPAIDEAAA